MKAKDIAAAIAADGEEGSALAALSDMLNGAVAVAKQRKSEASKLAVLREAFQKWRAVCYCLANTEEGRASGLALFPKAMQLMSKDLFVASVKGGVFLGYELDLEDKALVDEVVEKRERAHQEEMAQARFGVLFNHMMGRLMR